MSLTPALFSEIDAALAKARADAATIATLRRIARGMVVTRCDAADIRDETPYRTYEECNLYLLDTRDHCVSVTADPASATGLVLAPRG